jgi:hypothetical protein
MVFWGEGVVEIVKHKYEMIADDLDPDGRLFPLYIQNVDLGFPSFGVGLPR